MPIVSEIDTQRSEKSDWVDVSERKYASDWLLIKFVFFSSKHTSGLFSKDPSCKSHVAIFPTNGTGEEVECAADSR